jgi:dihydrofolate reductase
MSEVTCDMSMSVDGFVAGPNQSLASPFGEGVGDRLHRWMFEEPEANAAEIQGVTAAGAFIMGRNMFGPGRHDWDLDWKGWWGDEPPYHGPVFVESALAQAGKAAGESDIAIAGGAHTVNQYLAAGLIDELRLHVAPVLLGAGERLFDGVTDLALEPLGVRGTNLVTHMRYRVAR